MKLTAFIWMLSTGMAFAADPVSLHAAFLSEPTEWCTRDQGVPVIVTLSGLEVHGETQLPDDQPSQVRVRRGGQATERVEVGRIGVNEIRSRRGVDVRTIVTQDFSGIAPRINEVEPLGRLVAEMQVCRSFWTSERGDIHWRVLDADGMTVMSGSGQSRFNMTHRLDSRGGKFPRAVNIGDQVFVVMQRPEIIRTTEAFASPAKEQ